MQLSVFFAVALLSIGLACAHPIRENFDLGDHQCDGKTSCSDTATCCPFGAGFGCCPLGRNAICCPDKLHCCPAGTECDPEKGACTHKTPHFDNFIPMSKVRPADSDISISITEVKSVSVDPVPCPDNSECPEENTCCHLSDTTNSYACCPMPAAVCCSDGLHCCPKSYQCNSDGTCTDIFGAFSLQLRTKSPTEKLQTQLPAEPPLQDVKCKDNSSCPEHNTCCKLKGDDDSYGCCPHPNGCCCKDGLHCCPFNYVCQTDGTCTDIYGASLSQLQTKLTVKEVGSVVVCPDKANECPDGQTCCKQSSGGYACCPLPSAVCCDDENCCPFGYSCSSIAGVCLKGRESIPFIKKLPAISTPESVTCPDGQSQCPDGNTCCLLASGQYGCCPLPSAVCCSDGVHCCPKGYTCDVSAGTCTKGQDVIPFVKKLPALKSPQNVVCPDGTSECPDGNTCCMLTSGQYGCCPLPNAECCSDGVHCCPDGYTCDVSSGACSKSTESIFATAIATPDSLKAVVCPDSSSACPNGHTCCKQSNGLYGCCPYVDAVCCSDEIHCCPKDYTCDMTKGSCLMKMERASTIEKATAVLKSPQNVICPDGTSECPDGNTCCKTESDNYGCCPLPQAVCCSDGIHCCPNGYTCIGGACGKAGELIPLFKKLRALKVPQVAMVDKPLALKSPQNVQCPGGQSQCPDGNTCCLTFGNQYGCCPQPNAVCCSDKAHCCPSGYVCVTGGTCSKTQDVIPFLENLSASPKKEKLLVLNAPLDVTCPDGQSECQDGQTCCKLSTGQYGCCPIPQAVCCSDGVHCCPDGYTCDVSAGTCTKGQDVVPFVEKLSALKSPQNVVCPDGTSECPDGNTCCVLTSGQYGCCPLPNAECCSDGVHCCPDGYTCVVSTGTCTKGQDVVPFVKKLLALKSPQNIVCPDGTSECPDGNTCCVLTSGQYGCCPIPQAVCCSDGVHCCPDGYTCVVSTGTCTKGQDVIPFVKKLLALKSPQNIVCPDGTSECQDGQTCCKLSTGLYGCCPLPNAECCSDEVHCCPDGYTCDTGSGTCSKSNEAIDIVPLQTIATTPSPKSEGIIKTCPDWQTCPDATTCCELANNEYACCPLPSAVCCKDNAHCCPTGYACVGSSGTCVKEGNVIPAFLSMISHKPLVERLNDRDLL